MDSARWCIATVVTEKAISAMLEAGGEGSYRDDHPWLVAKDLLGQGDPLPILFASVGEHHTEFSHWSVIRDIDVVELHRAKWETRVSFGPLKAINPIWTSIDSVFIKPSAEQLEREVREGIGVSRHALDEHHIHPYAICEVPVFINEALASS